MYYLNSTSSTSSTSTRNGISGLMSGLNTEELVKNMTLGIRTKIAKQQQQVTLLNWKTDAYRSISSKLIGFADKYLSYTSSTNALSSNFFTSATVSALGANAGAVSVTGNSATVKSLSIQSIDSVAATASFLSSTPVASSALSTGTIDFSAAGKTVNNLAGETINLQLGSDKYNITIDKSFAGTDAASVAAAINTALANVELTGGGILTDKYQMSVDGGNLKLSATDPDTTETLKIIGGSGSSLSALGFDTSSVVTGDTPLVGTFDPANMTTSLNFFETVTGKSVNMTYNGVSKAVTMPDMSGVQDKDQFLAAFQTAVDRAFGANHIKVSLESDRLSFETVRSSGGSLIADSTSTLAITGGSAGLFGDKGVLNLEAGLSNRLIMGNSLEKTNFDNPLMADGDGKYRLDINGTQFEFESGTSLTKIVDTINNSDAGVKVQYLSTTNRFSVTATESGAHGRVDISDVGGNLAETLFGTQASRNITAGSDAQISISYDGGATTSVVTRSSNSFDLDGLNVKLNPGVAFQAGESITFEAKTNTDDIVKNIMSMVEEYNSIMSFANTELTAKYNRNYLPLTAEQRKDMSESEIKSWEEQAKTGLLMNDPTLRSLTSDLRLAFTVSLPYLNSSSDIGITASSNWQDNGKILIDEAKLRKALEERPDEVQKLFSGSEGIMQNVKDSMDKYINRTGANKGSLITLAGLKDSYTASESSLAKQIASYEKVIAQLQATQKTQENRYYKQFTALEKYISQMNAQSSWLYSQTGG